MLASKSIFLTTTYMTHSRLPQSRLALAYEHDNIIPRWAQLVSDGTAYTIAALYTLAGQAHFTDRFTPGLAEDIEIMTRHSHAAFWFLHLEYATVSRPSAYRGQRAVSADAAVVRSFRPRRGGFVVTAAYEESRIRHCYSIVGFSGRLYGQLYDGQDVTQVSVELLVVG